MKTQKEAEDEFVATLTAACIPLSDLPFVFDKGFTGDTGSYLSRSTGMGLYLVQKMATDLSITVELKNNSYGGTTVTLTCPKVDRPFGR